MKFQLCYPGGKKKALTFSYDDSHPDNLRLAGILNRHGMKATFNLSSALLPGENEEQKADYVKKLLAGGHEIACHGQTHGFFDRMPQLSLVEEVLEDRRRLEKISGRIVNGMAYPYRAYNAQVIETLRSLGIVYARAARSTGFFSLPADFLAWDPTCHHKENLPEVAERFLKCCHYGGLCYVWGHVFEFNRDNNWNIIEDFCAEVASAEDIWFATNGEICEYVTAFRRLVTSADTRTVRNPNAQSIWVFDQNGIPHEIKGGTQTVFE